MRDLMRMKKEDSKSTAYTSPLGRNVRDVHVPDAGPNGAHKLCQKTLKYAHPSDSEYTGSNLTGISLM